MITVKMIKTDKGNSYLAVQAPYQANFVARARTLGGKWSAADKAWWFKPEDEDLVRKALRAHYGEDGSQAVEYVTVVVTVSDCSETDEVTYLGRTLCSRAGRDNPVRLGEGVIIESGRFAASGGSVKHPRLGENNAMLRVKNVPKALADARIAAGDGIKIITEPKFDREALETEAETIRARLAEIEAILNKEGA